MTANIHATETTAGVAACYIIQHLVDGHTNKAPIITEALRTRTFYIVPRVNPDGVEVI
jgi:murein tripeptide amidase MpaA